MVCNVQVRSVVDGKVHHGHVTTEDPASSYGQPVLVLDGIGAVDHCWYEIVGNPQVVAAR